MFWSNTYSVGHPELDEQHRQLIETYNLIVDKVESYDDQSHDPSEIMSQLKRFSQMTEQHFYSEESILAEVGYPALMAHQLLHLQHTDSLSSYNAAEMSRKEYRENLLEAIGNWFINHILMEDMEYKYFMQQGDSSPDSSA
jgi:hemerythrin-like metal-binding protein